VAVGRLLNQDAELLLLDEPTRGIDIGSKAQIYETIARCAEEGKAVLLYLVKGRIRGALTMGADDETVERLKDLIRERAPLNAY